MRLREMVSRAAWTLNHRYPASCSATLLFVVSAVLCAWVFGRHTLPPDVGLFAPIGWLMVAFMWAFAMLIFEMFLIFSWDINYEFFGSIFEELFGDQEASHAPFLVLWREAVGGLLAFIIGIPYFILIHPVVLLTRRLRRR